MDQKDIPNINSEELRAFLSVAQYQSFIAAALTLGKSQPALTRLIQNLEKQLNVRLFQRTTRAVRITAEGRELVAISERLLNDLRIGAKRIRDMSSIESGQLIISSVMSVAHASLAKPVSNYHSLHPNIEIHIKEGVHGLVLDEVRSGASDIGITYIDELPDSIKSIKLGKESFFVVFPKGHRLQLKKMGQLSDLEGEDLISLPPNSRTRIAIDSAAAFLGIRLNHVVTVSQFATMMQFVENGAGIALVPEGALDQVNRKLVDSRLITKPKLTRELGIIYLKERNLSDQASKFVGFMRKDFRVSR